MENAISATRTDGPVGVLLAGGRARRMGGAKVGAQLAGKPLIAWAHAALRAVVDEVAVVAKPATDVPALDGAVRWDEPDADFHPRLGLVEALRRAEGRPVLALAADLPLMEPAPLRALLERGPTAVARHGGVLQPLCALYAPEALATLREAPHDEPLTVSVERLRPAVVPFGHPEWFLNVNRPDQLARAEALLSRRSRSSSAPAG